MLYYNINIMIFLILPNQLFQDTIKLKSYSYIYLIEEPHYFSSNEMKRMKIGPINSENL